MIAESSEKQALEEQRQEYGSRISTLECDNETL